MGDLIELIREQRALVASLRATSDSMRRTARAIPVILPSTRRILILQIAEHLIAAHKSAKIDNDGTTLDLIEDAMRLVGQRLAKEHGDDRDFRRKRLEPF